VNPKKAISNLTFGQNDIAFFWGAVEDAGSYKLNVASVGEGLAPPAVTMPNLPFDPAYSQ